MSLRRKQNAVLRESNKKYGPELQEIPKEEWPQCMPERLIRVFRSNRFLVQVTTEDHAGLRLSVNATRLARQGVRFDDGISWDELQAIKAQCGYGDWWGVEIYPRDRDVVNIANMRHIWIFETPLSIGWRWGMKHG